MKENRILKSLSRLLGAFLALAVLFAPVTARAMQMPSSAASHHENASSSHCKDAPKPAKHDKAPQKDCCASMCMAVAINPAGPAAHAPLISVVPVVSAPVLMLGSANELATPPPRLG